MIRVRYHIFTFFAFILSFGAMGQAVYLAQPELDTHFKVIIPKEVQILLPSSNFYSFRYFVCRKDTLFSVGRNGYSQGQDCIISLGYDQSGGKSGYKNGERLISLAVDIQSGAVYGIEFSYKDDKNTYVYGDSTIVTGVKITTWQRHITGFNQCKSIRRQPIYIPYGVHPKIFTTSDVVLDTTGISPEIVYEKMQGNSSHTIQIIDPYKSITYLYSLLSFKLLDFPLNAINNRDSICHKSVITIPTFTEKDSLEREAIGDSPYLIITPGQYLYKATYITNGCTTTDTVTIVQKQQCKSYDEPALMNPVNGGQIVFADTEKIRIFNSSMEKVTEFDAPAIWRGTNSSGAILPIGIYFIQYGENKQESITLIY